MEQPDYNTVLCLALALSVVPDGTMYPGCKGRAASWLEGALRATHTPLTAARDYAVDLMVQVQVDCISAGVTR